MGASVKACTVPGSTSSSPEAERVGATVATISVASAAVSWRRLLRAITRCTSPHVARMRATTSNPQRRRCPLRGAGSCGVFGKELAMWNLNWMCGVHQSAAVDDREDCWHKKQRCRGREDQPPDHGAPEGRVLLAAFTKTQRHRNH